MQKSIFSCAFVLALICIGCQSGDFVLNVFAEKPVAGATIRIDGKEEGVLKIDSGGVVHFAKRLPHGKHQISVMNGGHLIYEETFEVPKSASEHYVQVKNLLPTEPPKEAK